jgi:pseudouridine-5'-phosphate glycosidase
LLGRAGPQARKCSRRDLPTVLASRAIGATTVAGTMIAAEMAGIHVFVTGGIGGVHRGAETSFDVSADLSELGRTPVTVVCAGVKSILDIPKTLEVLETQGVPVVALGTDEFPAFFTPHSGVRAPERMDSPARKC